MFTTKLNLLLLVAVSLYELCSAGWSVNGGGYYRGGNDWGVSGSISYSWRKRSSAPFDINLKLNPCRFESYDENADGMITEEELDSVFENHSKGKDDEENQKTDAVVNKLFNLLDRKTADGKVTKEEFKANSPGAIKGC